MGHELQYIKRDKLNILLQILDIATIPVKKTHILYKANINFYQLTRYLRLLLDLQMIEEIKDPFVGFRITEKGRQLLNLFESGQSNIVDNPDKLYSRAVPVSELKRTPNLV